MKVETVSTNGLGESRSDGTKYVFTGPDAVKLEAMEVAHQSNVTQTFDQRFSAYASEKLGTDFNSLSPEAQAQFRVDNMQTAGAIMIGVQSELGPSPKQQLIMQQQQAVQQGSATEVIERKDLPVISPRN